MCPGLRTGPDVKPSCRKRVWGRGPEDAGSSYRASGEEHYQSLIAIRRALSLYTPVNRPPRSGRYSSHGQSFCRAMAPGGYQYANCSGQLAAAASFGLTLSLDLPLCRCSPSSYCYQGILGNVPKNERHGCNRSQACKYQYFVLCIQEEKRLR